MRDYFKVLAFEARMRWPLALLPVVFIATLLWLPGYTPTRSLNFPPIAFMGTQFMLMLYPIFQNRSFGFKSAGLPVLDFQFTQPISRRVLYFGKATIYLVGSLMSALIFLLMSINQSEARIAFPHVAVSKSDPTRDYFVSQFPGAVLEAQPGDPSGSVVFLPYGQIQLALSVLVLTWAGVVIYQLILGQFRRESALQYILQIGLGVGMLVGWVFLNISFSRDISIFTRATVFISQFLWPILLLLIVATVGVQVFCAQRFATREI